MIVLVSGLPGSGKSFFAGELAEKLNAVYLNSDRVRAVLHASGRYSFEDKMLVYREMLMDTENAVRERRDVVVDATFYRQSLREMFLRLAERYHVEAHVIEIVADEEVIRRRLLKPREYSEADFAVYEKVRDAFEPITIPHLTLQSADSNLEQMLVQAETYIANDRRASS